MKKIFYTFLLISPILFITSCEKDKEEGGCTDSQATNYNADADIDDSSCLYDLTGVWETTSAILNGTSIFPTAEVAEDLYYINFQPGLIGTETWNSSGELTSYGVWNGLIIDNAVTMSGTVYDYLTDDVIAVVPSIAFNIDFMTNNNNMTWRFVNYPNSGDVYVKTLVRSTNYSLLDW